MHIRRTSPGPDRERSTSRSDLLVVLGAVVLLTVGTASGGFEVMHQALESRWSLSDSATGILLVVALAGAVIALLQRRRGRSDRRRRVETESKYQAMIEHVPAVTYEWDPTREPGSTPADYISPQVERLVGFSAERWLEDPELWGRQVHPDDIADVMSAWNDAIQCGGPFVAEYRMRTAAGQEVWVRDEAIPVDETGLTRYHGVMFDISQRRGAEEALRDSQALTASIVGSALDAIVSMDERGTIVEFNPSAERIFGHRRQDVIGMPLSEVIVPPALRQEHERDLGLLLETGGGPILGQRLETTAIRADGSEFPVELAVTRFELQGRMLLTAYVRDVSERKEAEQQLRSTQERYRLLVEQLPAVVYIDAVDEIATAHYVSPQYESLTGYTPAERLADPGLWMRIVHPDDRELVIAESNRTNVTEDTYDIDHRIVRKDGRIIWVHDHAILVRSPGHEDSWQGVLTEITDRKLAEEALGTRDRILEAAGYAAERFLRAPGWRDCIDDVLHRLALAGSATRVGVFENTEQGSKLQVALRHAWVADDAPASLDLPGAPAIPYGNEYARWIEALSQGDVIHGLTSELPLEERAIIEQAGIRSSMIVPVIVDEDWWGYIGLDDCGRDRAWQPAEIDAVRVVASTLGSAIEREHRARRLTEAEERYRAIVEHVPAAIYLDRADASMRSIYISPQIEKIAGITPQEWIDDPDLWLTIIPADDRASVRSTYLEAVRDRRPWQAEYRVNTRDGRTIWVHDETTFITGADGEPMFLQGVLMDITERKLADQALRDSARHEREVAERLRALDEMKNTFLAAVSHELRSPLTSILGLSITLERGPALPIDDRQDLLERLAFNARKLDRLLKDLLDIDRLNRGIVEPQYRNVDVASLTRSTVESLEALGDREVEIDAQPLVLAVDPPKLERIVENLVTNAARHTPSSSQIWVTVEPFEEGALLTVEDDGPGVPADLRDAIFEPFRQGPTASPHSPGTGIGLSLVTKFAELHAGRAWVEDRPGGGAVFRVFLPSAPGTGIEATTDDEALASASADAV